MRNRLRRSPDRVEGQDIEAFVADIGDRLVATLTVQTGDRGLAEELTQETLIRCVQHWPKVSQADRPDAWAFRVAFNLTRSKWRRQSLERRHLQASSSDRSDERTDSDHREDMLMIRRAVTRLPERRRAVIVCRFLLGYDVRTTAHVLGCAEGTVKAQTAKGLEQLRRILGAGPPGRTGAGRTEATTPTAACPKPVGTQSPREVEQ